MTYQPGNSGYPPPSQPPGSYGSALPSFAATDDGPSKLPLYLSIAVIVLGLAAYLSSFGPMVTSGELDISNAGGSTGVTVALVASLLAAVGALPKAKNYAPIAAVAAVLGALLAISDALTTGDHFTTGWGLWLVLAFTVVQAIAAVGVVLLDSGLITAPTPKPRYDQFAQYGLPPGGYYGQPGSQQGGYPSYGGYPAGPSTGGFGAQSGSATGGFPSGSQPTQQVHQGQPSHHQGPPTPPTGFPSFSQPPAGGGQGSGSGSGNSALQQQGDPGQQAPSSAPSGPQQL